VTLLCVDLGLLYMAAQVLPWGTTDAWAANGGLWAPLMDSTLPATKAVALLR